VTQITNLEELRQELLRRTEKNEREALLEEDRGQFNVAITCHGVAAGCREAAELVQQLQDTQSLRIEKQIADYEDAALERREYSD